jgi:hypothetical protein
MKAKTKEEILKRMEEALPEIKKYFPAAYMWDYERTHRIELRNFGTDCYLEFRKDGIDFHIMNTLRFSDINKLYALFKAIRER